MNNTSLTSFMVFFVVISIFILLFINIASSLKQQPISGPFINKDHVYGSEVIYQGKAYPLNFVQQKTLIDILNHSIAVKGRIKVLDHEKSDIEKIKIYHFDHRITELIPYSYFNNNLIYSAPSWNKKTMMIETSDGKLRQLLKGAHD